MSGWELEVEIIGTSAIATMDVKHENIANKVAACELLYVELAHLVGLLEPMESDGTLNVPGLATLNGARRALSEARGEE